MWGLSFLYLENNDFSYHSQAERHEYVAVLMVDYGISNTIVFEILPFTTNSLKLSMWKPNK